jgi:hypothetical protein
MGHVYNITRTVDEAFVPYVQHTGKGTNKILNRHKRKPLFFVQLPWFALLVWFDLFCLDLFLFMRPLVMCTGSRIESQRSTTTGLER